MVTGVRQRRRLLTGTQDNRTRRFNARERRKSLFDPSFELLQTHTFDATQNPIGANRFPTDAFSKPVTFNVEIKQTGATPGGIVFAYGSDLIGFAIWLDGADIGVAAGGQATNGIAGTRTNALKGIDFEVRLTAIAHPGYGAVALYLDDDLELYATSTSGRFVDGWAQQSPGAVGNAPTLITGRVPAPQRVPITNAEIITTVRGFEEQYPRQLDSFLGETTGFDPLIPPPPVIPPPAQGGSFNASFNQSFDTV